MIWNQAFAPIPSIVGRSCIRFMFALSLPTISRGRWKAKRVERWKIIYFISSMKLLMAVLALKQQYYLINYQASTVALNGQLMNRT